MLLKSTGLEDSISLCSIDLYLLTKAAVVSELLLETRHAVIATLFGNQRFRSYWLSAVLTHKASFMPVVTFKFHFAGTWTPKSKSLLVQIKFHCFLLSSNTSNHLNYMLT